MLVNAEAIRSVPRLFLRGTQNRRVGLFARVFGCWHLDMSWPLTAGDETYRACLHCGAHRRFDPDTWLTRGPYYF